MHPRNPYKDSPPDFKVLASEFADFRSFCTLGNNGKIHFNFKEDAAVRALSKAIFEKDFGLKVELPIGCLVPRIPQRLNYLLWIEDLLVKNKIREKVSGIDIGTGASCVYALLGARKLGWDFLATDSDKFAVETAEKNVLRNELQDKIEVFHVNDDTILQKVFESDSSREFSFCMCNPPFFEADETDKKFTPEDTENGVFSNTSSIISSRSLPNSGTLARKCELQFEGGEVAFVGKMIEESIILKDKIKIYTSMLGKKISINALKQRLSTIEGLKFSTSILSQGKTQRWVIAWTFDASVVLDENLATYAIEIGDFDKVLSSEKKFQQVVEMLKAIAIDVKQSEQDHEMICTAYSCLWMKQRGKRRIGDDNNADSKRRRKDNSMSETTPDEDDASVSTTTEATVADSDQTVNKQQQQDDNNIILQFRLCQSSDTNSLLFKHYIGSKQSLNSLIQYVKNRLRSL